MTKPTAEQWEVAWKKVETYVNINIVYSLYLTKLSERMKSWRPKEKACEPEPEPTDERRYTIHPSPGISIFEVVDLAEQGDEFEHPCWGRWSMDSGVVVGVGHQRVLKMDVTKMNLNSKSWHFTKRAKRCPHCGGVVEE